jgi:hypothetical protein
VPDHRLGVQAVELPELPGGLVGAGVGAEPEALDLEPLDRGVDDQVAPVVGQRREQVAERLAVLGGGEQQPVVAVVVGLAAVDPRAAGLDLGDEVLKPDASVGLG